MEIYWAALRSGLYVTFINSQLSAGEAACIVNDCGAQTFVVADPYAAVAERMAVDTPRVTRRIALGALSGFPAGVWTPPDTGHVPGSSNDDRDVVGREFLVNGDDR